MNRGGKEREEDKEPQEMPTMATGESRGPWGLVVASEGCGGLWNSASSTKVSNQEREKGGGRVLEDGKGGKDSARGPSWPLGS